ncbi:MAG: hypothetical protein QOH84_6399, partial [Kribbellaceae bacterium]|nr:hypothetical protein [Kribbellaceae bacterium]
MSSEDPGFWSVSRRRALQLTGGVAVAGTLPIDSADAVPATATDSRSTGGSASLSQGTNFMVSVSPDGRWLAFDLVTAIWVTPAGGGQSRRLTDDLQ